MSAEKSGSYKRRLRWGLAGVVLFCAGSLNAQGIEPFRAGDGGIARLVEITAVARSVSHRYPWRNTVYVQRKSPGFYVAQDLVLASRLDIRGAVSFVVRDLRTGRRYSASIMARDAELRLAILKLHREKAPADKTVRAMKIISDISEFLKGVREVQCLNLRSYTKYARPVKQTIFLKGVRSRPAPGGNTRLPTLLFSSWEPGIAAGDLLVTDNNLVGIVLSFDDRTRYGHAMPAVFIDQYLRAYRRPATGGKKGPLVIKEKKDIRRPDATIVAGMGFRYMPVERSSMKSFLGVSDKVNPILVTHVFAYGGAFERLIKGDVILAVDGEEPGPGGTLRDRVLGRLPLDAALAVKNGRLRRSGESIKLRISRNKTVREIEIFTRSFSFDNYYVPPMFPRPAYRVLQGLVLVELSSDYIKEAPGASHRLRYLEERARYRRYRNDDRYVVLDRVLPVKANAGYSERGLLVLSVNGIGVRSLRHLESLVNRARAKKLPIVLYLEGNREIVLNPDNSLDADREVRRRHGIQFMSDTSK